MTYETTHTFKTAPCARQPTAHESSRMNIELELIRLRAALNDALWDQNIMLAAGIQSKIERLEMLQSMGETYDVDH